MSHAKRIRKMRMRINRMKRGKWLSMKHMIITLWNLKKHKRYIDWIEYEHLIRYNTTRYEHQ